MKLLLTVLLAALVCGCVIVPVDGKSGKAGGGTTLVCHKGKKTLELPQDAVRAHLNHGDYLGPC
jgi:hypothetical protein